MSTAETVQGLVSIMIPTYERPKLFEKTLRSALAQTYPKVEIIVCDNSRDEATAQMMQGYAGDSRVRYVRNRRAMTKEENFMPFEDLAHGEYLQWLMDDDVLEPEKLRLMVECFERDPGITLVTSQRGVMDGEGSKVGKLSFLGLENGETCQVFDGAELGRRMLRDMRNYIGEPSAVLFRRRDLQHHYWRAEAKGYRTISDVAMWLELLEKGKCAVFRDSLSYYRRHGEQEGQQKDVILQSRMEWLRLGTEYYRRRVFLETREDYAHLLALLRDEYDRVKPYRMPEFLECGAWDAYAQCMDGIRAILDGREAVCLQEREKNGRKIVVVSMVKNEADIIESFVRHSLAFADEIIIANHSSADKTGEILENLREEGLPVFVRMLRPVELAHAEVMNELLREAVREHHANLVLPLDADEFLVNTDSEKSCREVLEGLSPEGLHKLEWRLYEPLRQHEEEGRFLLSRPCRRSRDFAPGQKLAVGGEIALRPGFRLMQGCHYACWEATGEKVPWTVVPDLHLAHYHWRSDEQYAAKVATSWINNVAKYSVYTPTASYLKTCYEKLGKGETVSPGSAIEEPMDFDLKPYCEEIPLRYSGDVRPDVLRNLMGASVLIAEAYLEEKVLRQGKRVTVVIPYFGDDEELRRNLGLAMTQTYPFKEIFVCGIGASTEQAQLPEGLREGIRFLDDMPGEDVFRQLSREATGEYVQWLLPGYSMQEDKLMKMVACTESQDFSFGILFADGRREFAPTDPYTDVRVDPVFGMVSPESLWQELLCRGKYPSGSMNGALVCRSLMEECRWLRPCFLDGKPLPYVMWAHLLQQLARAGDGAVGIIGEPLCERTGAPLAANDLLWHQMEWFALLNEYGRELPAEKRLRACRNFCGLRQAFAPMRDEVSPELWQQYGMAVEAMEKEMSQ